MHPSARPSVDDKRRRFHELHRSDCFVIPNPWDAGSARFLESLGFEALASTSSGFAWSQARADGAVTRDAVLDHLRTLVEAVDVPVNADFQSGFGADFNAVHDSVQFAVQTGIAGLSIEDATGNPDRPLFDLPTAVERIKSARAAIDRHGPGTLLVARAECFLVGLPNLTETIARLKAYAEAGADCLYAPGVKEPEQVGALVRAVAPKPINLLLGSSGGMSVQAAAQLGVRRVSIGGALARVGWGAVMRAARMLRQQGRFDGFDGAASGAELDGFFSHRGAPSR